MHGSTAEATRKLRRICTSVKMLLCEAEELLAPRKMLLCELSLAEELRSLTSGEEVLWRYWCKSNLTAGCWIVASK